MNIPVLIVAVIMTLASIGHVTIGTKETASLEPKGQSGKSMANWVQTMSAFQMLTVDLLILTGLLFWIALWDVSAHEPYIILGIAGYFALQGTLWLGHILWLRRDGATLTSLPHWGVWYACAAVLFLGA